MPNIEEANCKGKNHENNVIWAPSHSERTKQNKGQRCTHSRFTPKPETEKKINPYKKVSFAIRTDILEFRLSKLLDD